MLSLDVVQDMTEAHTAEKLIEQPGNIQKATVHPPPSGGIENKFIDVRREKIGYFSANGTFKVVER